MIKLLLEPVNCLILDEPTNHLDMRSKDVLKEAIRDFEGTVILVSHDREFLDGLVGKVYEFANGKVREHLGGIYDFLNSKQIAELTELNTSSPLQQRDVSANVDSTATQKDSALSYEQQKAASRLRKKLEKAVHEAEEHVTQLESAVKILEAQLSTPEGSADITLYEKHGKLKAQLAAAEEEWEKAMESLELND